ncbi:MAG: hypothetical protein EAZ79_01640 [Oscillatoriales cyanobacterium]|nr:MAG: hypothetical protein EAZ79_01640 [Oscillatoriales cyanobacterium]
MKNSLGVKVDQVDQVDPSQSQQGFENTPPQKNEVDQVDPEVDPEVERIETELVEFIRSAIGSDDRETAKHIQDVLREVCDLGKADRERVWGALSPTEQEAFKKLVKSPIDPDDAQKLRDIALIFWEEQYPDQLQSLIVQIFGWDAPGQKYNLEIIKNWLAGESELVRDRIKKLIEIHQSPKS